jgi:hypothetical protein
MQGAETAEEITGTGSVSNVERASVTDTKIGVTERVTRVGAQVGAPCGCKLQACKCKFVCLNI